MSKSVKRVTAALEAAGWQGKITEMPESTRTAAEAAAALGCVVDQIAKSVIFSDAGPDRAAVFITAGGNQVDPDKAAALARSTLGRADAGFVRRVTGFAIGGVAPLGHLTPPRAFFDPKLLEYDLVWAAAGTPRHVFPIEPEALARATGAQVSDFTP
jgi:prolyl-tRNA editing enzyme YbaK/EbsC (Cys-tRNA(Pro) deacylase)